MSLIRQRIKRLNKELNKLAPTTKKWAGVDIFTLVEDVSKKDNKEDKLTTKERCLSL